MPGLKPKSIERVRNVCNIVEDHFINHSGQDPSEYGEQPDVWFKLTEDMDQETFEAEANPGAWAASGDGELTADTSQTHVVRDTRGKAPWLKGDWVLCRPMGSANATVWEILSDPPQIRMAWATTTVAVASGDADFTVTNIVMGDGSTWEGDDPLTVKNQPDQYNISNGVRGKIEYVFDDDGKWAWHPNDYKC